MTTLGGTTLGGGAKKAAPKKAKPAKKAAAPATATPAAATDAPAPATATPNETNNNVATSTTPIVADNTTPSTATTTPAAPSPAVADAPSTAESTATSTPAPVAATPAGATSLPTNTAAPAGLSAAAKKKLKKKAKAAAAKEEPAAKPADGKPKIEDFLDAAGDDDKKGGKKAGAKRAGPAQKAREAMAARILKEQEDQRRAEEEAKRLAEEEARREEEERIAAEIKAKEDAEKRLKRNAEAKKRKEENAKLEAEKRRQAHLARLGVAAPKPGDKPAAPKKQSQMYTGPKKAKVVATSTETVEVDTTTKPAEEEEDSWEAMAAPGLENEEKKEEASAEETKIEEIPTEVTPAPEAKKQSAQKDLRSPICCVLGHVDTGKTKLLDKIRHTNVQGGEAGGITQQIGATYFPLEVLQAATQELVEGTSFTIRVPGLLIIDTPGHESFTNLRSRGSSLCDIAILVVDIMHGIEPQTIESIKLLRMRKTPFIVALNKCDRLFGWKSTPNAPFQTSLKKQANSVVQEFENRVQETIVNFGEQGLNAALYYKNTDMNSYVSLVPTSAVTGEGIPDLLALLLKLTQTRLSSKITSLSTFQATVLEVKVVEGLGTTIDVILSNGVLHEGDRIVMAGLDQVAIATNIRALLTPHPCKEIRVKTPYQRHKEVKAAQGVKISASGLDRAVAGSSLLVVGPDDDEEEVKASVQKELTDLFSKVSKKGVWVQASTLGSLEALLVFLKQSEIPVSKVNLGPVHRNDVVKAAAALERDNDKHKEYGTILAFDVKVTRDAREEAGRRGVKIFTADIIYHLFDQFTAYVEELRTAQKVNALEKMVYPVALEILPDHIFNQKEPILVGCRVKEGTLKLNTPLVIQRAAEDDPKKKITRFIGRVTGIEENRKPQQEASTDALVAVKIEGGNVLYGRHFDHTDELFAQITRESIDLMKEYFRDDLKDKALVRLVQKLKGRLDIL